MKIKWCWRCRKEVPMLDETEFRLCRHAMIKGKKLVEQEIAARNIEQYNWVGTLPGPYESQRYSIDMYRVLTGFEEANPNAIWHHQLDLYGEDCPRCRKPLRSKSARYCPACGFGKDALAAGETRPLVIRNPELFKKNDESA